MRMIKIEHFLKLIKENPDLPIIPMVNGEVTDGEGSYWIGQWGYAQVDEYIFATRYGKMLFKSDDDVFDALECYLTDEELELLPETESECRPFYDKLPWKKAIIVYIEPNEG